MEIKFYHKVKDPALLDGILKLLTKCDKEFVPWLSSRESTAQKDLHLKQQKSEPPRKYFKEISEQSALLALENNQVVGLMSFRENYICEHIGPSLTPNVYITTVAVHPDFRNRGIAGKLYEQIMKKYRRRNLFTRTWSTNDSHIRILISLGFHEHCYLNNDRGEGIDTVYYRFIPKKRGVIQYIQQYQLNGNLMFFLLLSLFSIVFIYTWITSEDGIFHELSLAIATSLMASLLCLVSDTFLKYQESKTDHYINTLKSYGIDNLQFNKNEILEQLIPKCREEIWISGCRLIMTSKASFRRALTLACQRSDRMHIKLLATPPWSTAYKLTYGEEDVSMNYIEVLHCLLLCKQLYNLDLEVHFSEKPLFSDTYKVDDRFITGPYLHCVDRYDHRITAKDFFSLDIGSPEKELYQLIHSDYMTLWKESTAELNLDRFAIAIHNAGKPANLTKEQRLKLLQDCCDPLHGRKVTPQ